MATQCNKTLHEATPQPPLPACCSVCIGETTGLRRRGQWLNLQPCTPGREMCVGTGLSPSVLVWLFFCLSVLLFFF